jgi:glucoamylase
MFSFLAVALAGLTAASPVALQPRQQYSSVDLNSWIERERLIALPAAIKNIGGTNNTDVSAADPGIVVASPSTVNPDYFCTLEPASP